ncbi:calcium/sodium antiporter [Defluviimonas sp. WL0075]|uniref:Calcium/sodium antiporter n=1 Tax=Albidovulum sediminicola TaxID=2984331 RepID=A0ABT2Z0L9_9RHOB|nr:calcium/sodium antiporter [Defluviimonas sp. WL0075]MCV2864694.1 calcium/sodium antiporter [Defluviimonas sp. WL0075]
MIFLMFLAGLAGLILGGEFLVRGAVGIAQRFHVPPLVIGLTIVGFGTSTPELLVSVQAALGGVPALALGNVVGSNIANVLLILGLSAMIVPVVLNLVKLKRDFVFMLGATLALCVVLLDGVVSRIEGGLLVVSLIVYLWICLTSAREIPETAIRVRPVWQSVALLAVGFVGLLLGANALVASATQMARAFGVSEAVIGLTIVAIGTSLPEMATGVLAAIRKHPEIAIGNVLGSNIFNILGILGITAAITPIPVDSDFSALDIGLAAAAAFALLAFAAFPGRIGRVAGVGLLGTYGGYLVLLGFS